MGYSKTTWVNGESPAINAINLNNIETGIEQNNLFHLLLTNDRYKITQFDTPSAGDITETIYLKAGDVVFATLVTEFDTPSAGDITTTLECTDLGIHNRVIVEFDTPSAGDITETSEEVI